MLSHYHNRPSRKPKELDGASRCSGNGHIAHPSPVSTPYGVRCFWIGGKRSREGRSSCASATLFWPQSSRVRGTGLEQVHAVEHPSSPEVSGFHLVHLVLGTRKLPINERTERTTSDSRGFGAMDDGTRNPLEAFPARQLRRDLCWRTAVSNNIVCT